MNEAGSNGLQQHAARLNVITATHCSRCHHSAEAIFTGNIPATHTRVVPATRNVQLPFSLCDIATASSSCTHSYWPHAALAVCDDTVSGRVKLEVPLILTFQVVVVTQVL